MVGGSKSPPSLKIERQKKRWHRSKCGSRNWRRNLKGLRESNMKARVKATGNIVDVEWYGHDSMGR